MTTTTQTNARRELAHLKTRMEAFGPLLQAAADGKTIQYRRFDSEPWEDGSALNFSAPPQCYRVKPEVQAVQSRRYLCRIPGSVPSVGVCVLGQTLGPTSIQQESSFLGWIDHDWVTHEVPEVAK